MSFSKVTLVALLFTIASQTHTSAEEKLTAESLLSPLKVTTPAKKKKKTDPKNIIKQVVITGNTQLNAATIKKELITRKGDTLNPIKINRSLRNVQSLGIFKNVKSQVTKTDTGAILTIMVEENPTIQQIKFDGNSVYSDKKLAEIIKSKPKTIYNLSNTRHDIQTIETLYKDEGYNDAKVIRIQGPSKKQNNNTLTFFIAEGVINSITITGNLKTQDYVITRELDLEPGMIINEKEIRKNLRRLYNLNYFTDINPIFHPAKKPNTYDMEIQLTEKETNGSFTFGGGYSPSSGFSIFSDLFWDNVAGTGQLVMLKGNFGMGSSENNLRNSTYQFKYHNPWMWDERRSFTFRTWLTDGRLSAISPINGGYSPRNERRRGFDTTFGVPHSEEIRMTHKAKFEGVSLPDIDRKYDIYSYTFGISYDTRDFIFNPREGVYHTLSVEQGFKFRLDAIDFTQIDIGLHKYIPTYKKQTIALRTKLGHIRSPQIHDTEIFESQWYFVGGSNTVRGYYDLNPFAYGNSQAIFSAEYRFLFTPNFQTILFVDAGFASTSKRQMLWLSNYKVGKGVGIRFNVPAMGPIRLDMGITETGETRIHFNMGYSF